MYAAAAVVMFCFAPTSLGCTNRNETMTLQCAVGLELDNRVRRRSHGTGRMDVSKTITS